MSASHTTPAFERGMRMRTEVLGAEHVARQEGADVSDLQRFVTEFGWGTIWPRPQLPPHTRSFITVAMLIALGKPHELEVHLRGALNNGCTDEELREVAIHAAVYCGFPAALEAMRHVDAVLQERS